jgi:hypothetical protein
MLDVSLFQAFFILCHSKLTLGEILSQIQGLAWIKMGGVNGYRELFSFTFDPLISTNFIRFGISLTIRINLGNLVGIIVGALLYLRA